MNIKNIKNPKNSKKSASLITLVSLLSSQLGSSYAWATNPQTCMPTCEQYRTMVDGCNSKKDQPAPSASPKAANDPIQANLSAQLAPTQSRCDQVQLLWGQVGPHCDAIKVQENASDAENIGFIVYTVAAVTCAAACVAQQSIVYAGAGVAACGIAGGSAVLVEMGAIVSMSAKFSALGDGAGVAGAIGSAVAAPIISTAASKGSQQLAQSIAACASAGLFLIGAIAKKSNQSTIQDLSAKECDSILASQSQAPEYSGGGRTGTPPPAGGSLAPSSGPNAPSAPGSGGRAGSSPSASALSALQELEKGGGGTSKFASATAGPVAPLYGALSKDKLDVKKILNGTNEDIAKALAQGATASSLLAAAGGDLAKMGEGLKTIENAVRSGDLRLNGASFSPTSSSYASSGAKGGGSGGAKPGLGFGALFGGGGASAGSASDLKFDHKKEILPSAEGDIWHEGYGGSIFQIISQKLVRTGDRIDHLEWDHPLNRALAGLPPKKPAPGAK